MLDFLVLLFGINGIEALFYILFCIGFKTKQVPKFDLFLCWGTLTFLNYSVTEYIQIPVPMISQSIFICLGIFMLNKILNLDLINCTKYFLIVVGVLLIVEVPSHFLYLKIFNLDLFNIQPSTLKFVYWIPTRIIEFITIIGLSKILKNGVD